MSILDDYINKDLIFLDFEAESQEYLLQYMAKKLKENGNVKDAFITEVIKREKIYPTGLRVENIGVALPHSDIEYVNSPAVSLAVLKKTIDFHSMENNENIIPIDVVFMLAVNKGDDQLTLLQEIISLIQSKERMKSIINAKTKEEILNSLTI